MPTGSILRSGYGISPLIIPLQSKSILCCEPLESLLRIVYYKKLK